MLDNFDPLLSLPCSSICTANKDLYVCEVWGEMLMAEKIKFFVSTCVTVFGIKMFFLFPCFCSKDTLKFFSPFQFVRMLVCTLADLTLSQ